MACEQSLWLTFLGLTDSNLVTAGWCEETWHPSVELHVVLNYFLPSLFLCRVTSASLDGQAIFSFNDIGGNWRKPTVHAPTSDLRVLMQQSRHAALDCSKITKTLSYFEPLYFGYCAFPAVLGSISTGLGMTHLRYCCWRLWLTLQVCLRSEDR